MLSLFQATTSGVDWNDIFEPLEPIGAIFNGIFIFYIIFFTFVLVNTLTSIFVDATIRNSDNDYHMVIDSELAKNTQYVRKLKAFFNEINKTGDGLVTYEDFGKFIKDPRMQAFAASMDVEIVNAKQFFDILSDDGKRPVDLETFVVGCMRLKGAARNVDLTCLMHAHKRAAHDQQAHFRDIGARLQRLEKSLSNGSTLPGNLSNDIDSALPRRDLSNDSASSLPRNLSNDSAFPRRDLSDDTNGSRPKVVHFSSKS